MTPTAPTQQLGRFTPHGYTPCSRSNGVRASTFFPPSVRVAMFRLSDGGLRCLVDFTRRFEITPRDRVTDLWLPGGAYVALNVLSGSKISTSQEDSILRLEITNFGAGFTDEFLGRVRSDLEAALGPGFDTFVALLRLAQAQFFPGSSRVRSGDGIFRSRTPALLELMRCRLYEFACREIGGLKLRLRYPVNWEFDALEYLRGQMDWWRPLAQGELAMDRHSYWRLAARDPELLKFLGRMYAQAVLLEQERRTHLAPSHTEPVAQLATA